MKHSIVRRSSAVTAAHVLGHGFGYALMWAANYTLNAEEFARFYTTWVIITIAIAPITALLLVLGRSLADMATKFGRPATANLTLRMVKVCLSWGLPTTVIASFVLFLVGKAIAHADWAPFLLIPAMVFLLVLVEVLRTSFQAMLLFRWSSCLWIASQFLQVALSIIGLALSQRAWPGILGCLMGAGFIFLVFVPWFVRQGQDGDLLPARQTKLHFRQEAGSIISYFLFVLVSNMDILVVYWMLPTADAGLYAASALLPRAIVTMTFPIAQVVLPVMVEQKANGLSIHRSILKALALALTMSGAMAALQWIFISPLQSSPLALRGMDISVAMLLATGSVALSGLRVLVVIEIALQRFIVGLMQICAIILFAAGVAVLNPSALELAYVYTLLAWVLTFIMACTIYIRYGGLFLPANTLSISSQPSQNLKRTGLGHGL